MARGRTMTALPSAQTEGVGTDERRTRYGEQVVAAVYGSRDYIQAAEGSYFVFQTATPGTPYNMGGATQTAFVATTPTVSIYNSAAAGGKSLYLDFISISFATAGVAGTRIEGALVTDTVDRYSSGGTALVGYNVNSGSTIATGATVYAGAVTAAAATAAKYVGRFTLSTAIPAIGETYRIEFAAPNSAGHTSKIARVAPIVVPPTDSLLLYLWSPSQSTAPTVEVSVGLWER